MQSVYLTVQRSAGSNTALFQSEQADEAHLPTVEDAPSAASRVPRSQPYRRGTRGSARAARARPQASLGIGPRRGVSGRGKRARYGFGADRKLARNAEFVHLLSSGKRRSLAGYTFYLERRAGGPPRLGILVSRKHAARATLRNSIKRCIREAFRLEQERLGPIDVLVRPPYGARGSAAMLAQLRVLLGKLDA